MNYVRYIFCLLFPPFAILLCGTFRGLFLNLFLTLFLWIPGVVHSMWRVSKYHKEIALKREVEEAKKFRIPALDALVKERGDIQSVLLLEGIEAGTWDVSFSWFKHDNAWITLFNKFDAICVLWHVLQYFPDAAELFAISEIDLPEQYKVRIPEKCKGADLRAIRKYTIGEYRSDISSLHTIIQYSADDC